MSYQHLNINQRNKIEAYVSIGYSARRIAQLIQVHHSTVSREIKRCKGRYSATKANQHYQDRSSLKGRKYKFTECLGVSICKCLASKWSPEQIVGRLLKGRVSVGTIYNWLYTNKISFSVDRLRHKGKRRRPIELRGTFKGGKTIADRPKSVENRSDFGHWELDTVVSGRGKSKGCVATFVERMTRFYVAIKKPIRSAECMFTAIR